MSDLSYLLSFQDELEKIALSGALDSLKKSMPGIRSTMMSSPVGYAAGLGAKYMPMVGGAYGMYTGYRDAKREGQGTAGALASGAMKGLTGAMAGSVVGTAGGAGIGMALKNNKGLAEAAAKNTEVTNKGLRQIHGFTGWAPERAGMNRDQALRSIGVGNNLAESEKLVADKSKELQDARRLGDHAGAAKIQKELVSAEGGRKALSGAHNFFGQGDGLTSLPAYARGLMTRPLDTIATAGKEMIHGGGTSNPMKYIPMGFVGLSALSLPGQLSQAGENGNPGTGEVLGKFTANAASGFMGAGVPFAAQQLMGKAAPGFEAAGGLAGKAVDKTREALTPQEPPQVVQGNY